MLKNKRLLILALFAVIVSSIGAQTNSPYSRYGYGVLRDQATGVSKSMGGARYGVRNSLNANAGNPASYSGVDSLTFLFDIGLYMDFAQLSDPSGRRNDVNGGLDYITMLFPVAKNLGFSAGLLPVSSVGYDFASKRTESSIAYTKSYEGSGGLSQVYMGVGYELPFVKNLSLGLNASYIFGKLEHKSHLNLTEINGLSTLKNTDLRVNSYKLDFGIQYELPLNKDNVLTLGAVYTPKVNSTGSFKEITTESLMETVQKIDTFRVSGADAGMPHTIGFGAGWQHKDKWTVAADLTYQNWSGIKYSHHMGDGIEDPEMGNATTKPVYKRFNNRWRYNLGGEYVANPYSRNFFQRVRLRGGVNYSESYINARTQAGEVGGYNEYGATFGFGIPIRDTKSFGARTSYININFDYKLLDPKISTLVKERYFGVSVSVSFNERWFFKRKIN